MKSTILAARALTAFCATRCKDVKPQRCRALTSAPRVISARVPSNDEYSDTVMMFHHPLLERQNDGPSLDQHVDYDVRIGPVMRCPTTIGRGIHVCAVVEQRLDNSHALAVDPLPPPDKRGHSRGHTIWGRWLPC